MIKNGKVSSESVARLERVGEVFAGFPGVAAAWLHGSYAGGTPTPLSDIDLAYLFAPSVPAGDWLDRDLELDARLASFLGTDEVDCRLLNKAPLPFAYRVVTRGRLVHVGDERLRVEYQGRIIMAYFDFSYYVDQANALHLRRLALQEVAHDA